MPGNIGELPVSLSVGPKHLDLLEADGVEKIDDVLLSDAVKRRVDDLDGSRFGKALFDMFLQKCGINFGRANLNIPVFYRRFEGGLLDLVHLLYPLDDQTVVGWDKLSARRPVHLDRIVARRIVAGRNHDSGGALFVANHERQFGRAAIVIKEIDFEPIGDHDARAEFREMSRIDSSIVGDGTCLRR